MTDLTGKIWKNAPSIMTVGRGKTNLSLYAHGFDLMQDFIEQHKELIKDCLMSKNPYTLARKMGKKNYDELAKIVNSCVDIASKHADAIVFEINKFIDSNGIKNATLFEIAHVERKWTPITKEYLDCYLQAEHIFNQFNQKLQDSIKV